MAIHIHAWDDSLVSLDMLGLLLVEMGSKMSLADNALRYHPIHVTEKVVDPLAEMMALYRANQSEAHLMICDLEMPLDCVLVLRLYRENWPECRRVLLTSRDRPRSDTRLTQDPSLIDTAMRKPIDVTHLRAILRLVVLKQERW